MEKALKLNQNGEHLKKLMNDMTERLIVFVN